CGQATHWPRYSF
nr:immunoglobulin light chain junction region [Macaca mulatta]